MVTLSLPLGDNVLAKDASLSLDLIASPEYQMRRTFDEARLQELARTMDLLGQLQRIGVRPDGSTGRYVLIYGERRLRAARLLGWTHIDARIFEIPEGPATLITHATENLQRVDPELVEYLDVVLRLREANLTEEVIARALGKSPAWVSNTLRIASDPTGRTMAEAGLLANALAWPRFMDLPERSRKKLLDMGEPITAAMCRHEEQRLEAAATRAQINIPLEPAAPVPAAEPLSDFTPDISGCDGEPVEPRAATDAQAQPPNPRPDDSTGGHTDGYDDDWGDGRRAFCAGVCEALHVVADADLGTVWKKIVRAAGKAELICYASRIEPAEWDRAGFSKFAQRERPRSQSSKLRK